MKNKTEVWLGALSLMVLRGNLSDLKNRIEEDVEKGIWRQQEHYE